MILNNQIWGIQHVQTKPPIFGFHIAKGCATGISSIHCASVVGIRLATSCTSNFLFELVKPFLARSAFLFQDLYNISRRYRHVFLSFTYPHLWHFQCLKSEKVGLYMCCLTQWIGFVGKIYTGNQSYFPMKYGVFRWKCSQQNQSIAWPIPKCSACMASLLKSSSSFRSCPAWGGICWFLWHAIPGLVNVYITMENHHFLDVNEPKMAVN